MKILHAMSGNPVGGTELAFERAVSALAREDLDQRVVIKADSGRRARLNSADIDPIELPFRPRLDFTSKRRLNNEIASYAPDIVMSWTPDVSVQVGQFSGKHLGYIGREFSATQIQSCDHLFAASQKRVDRVIAAGWPKDRISLLPHIISPSTVKPIDRKTFFTPETAKLIVVVGNLDPESSLDIVFGAVARISELYLWVVGENSAVQDLQDKALMIGIKPRSRFVGWRYDALSLISAADLVVCPALQDDIGSGVLEAWACGKPVIVADSIGQGLLIRHRENGVLVPIDDTRSLAEAIKWVMQDQSFAERMAKAGFELFNQSYAASSVLPQYMTVFKQLVEEAKLTSAPAQ